MTMNLKPSEAAKIIGVTYETLKNWDKNDVLKSFRTPTNRRYYTRQQLNKFLNIRNKKRGQSELKFSVDATLHQDLKDRAYEQKKSLADYIRGVLINDLYGISETDTDKIKQSKLSSKLDQVFKQMDGVLDINNRLRNIEGILSDVLEEDSLIEDNDVISEAKPAQKKEPEISEERRKELLEMF